MTATRLVARVCVFITVASLASGSRNLLQREEAQAPSCRDVTKLLTMTVLDAVEHSKKLHEALVIAANKINQDTAHLTLTALEQLTTTVILYHEDVLSPRVAALCKQSFRCDEENRAKEQPPLGVLDSTDCRTDPKNKLCIPDTPKRDDASM